MKSRCFKLYCAYPSLSIRQMLAIFFRSSILKDCIKVQEKKEKVVVLRSRPPPNVNRHLHVVIVVQWRQRNVQKSVKRTRAKLLFCQSKPIAFLPFLLTSPPSLLKLPIKKLILTPTPFRYYLLQHLGTIYSTRQISLKRLGFTLTGINDFSQCRIQTLS